MKPTIVVVGLLPAQTKKVEQQCKKAKIKFVQSQGDIPRIPNGDYVVLLPRFVRHLWTTEALKRWPRNRVFYHMGGINGLASLLNDISK